MQIILPKTNSLTSTETNTASILLEGDTEARLLDTAVMVMTNFIGWIDDPLMSPQQKLDAMRAELDADNRLRGEMSSLLEQLHYAAWSVSNDDSDYVAKKPEPLVIVEEVPTTA